MHPELIKASLRMKGLTATAVAKSLGVSDVAVGYVIHSRRRSVYIARRICELTGIDPAIAWPGRYPEFHHRPINYAQLKEVA